MDVQVFEGVFGSWRKKGDFFCWNFLPSGTFSWALAQNHSNPRKRELFFLCTSKGRILSPSPIASPGAPNRPPRVALTPLGFYTPGYPQLNTPAAGVVPNHPQPRSPPEYPARRPSTHAATPRVLSSTHHSDGVVPAPDFSPRIHADLYYSNNAKRLYHSNSNSTTVFIYSASN